MVQTNVREIALQLLIRIEHEGGFSHLLLSDAIKKSDLSIRDEKLLTELVYGTIEYKLTLDFYLHDYIQKQKKLLEWVHLLLRMSIFQIAYLDKVPTFAVINEAVNIAKRRGHKGIASIVNGVLRNIDRNGLKSINSIKDPIERLAIETSHPKWLIDRWITYYGMDTTIATCEANNTKKPVYIRVNQLKTTRDSLIEQLEAEWLEVIPSKLIRNAIIITKGNILKTSYLDKGYVTIQDLSSMLAAEVLQVDEGMNVLDACSAPGGKATYLAELMNNTGEIHAYDLHKNKINVIKRNQERLELSNITAKTQDARKLQQDYQEESFDRILVDAPCSGFGVIRSKPDIKYNKTEKDIHQLQKVQFDILNHVASLVKKDGKIVYSTCTIEKMENEAVIKMFLDSNKDFTLDETFFKEMEALQHIYVTPYGIQIFPHSYQSDGFFMTRLSRLHSKKR